MSQEGQDALVRRLRDIEDDIRLAHEAFQAGDAKVCGWRARTATEGMLAVLCSLHRIPVSDPGSRGTIETLRKQLRHAKVLDRAMEDHVQHIQNIGNRAAHAQHGARSVDLHDAASLIPALDSTAQRFRELVPADMLARAQAAATSPADMARALDRTASAATATAAPAPSSLWRDALTWVAALAALPLAFGVTTVVLRTVDPSSEAPTHAQPAAPLVDAAALEADLDAAGSDSPPSAQTTPLDERLDGTLVPVPRVEDVVGEVEAGTMTQPPLAHAVDTVFHAHMLRRSELVPLDCTDLQWTRSWVWARHGYPFTSAAARAYFARQADYIRDASTNRKEVERSFSVVDKSNLELLNERMAALGCPCPRPGKKSAPCPD